MSVAGELKFVLRKRIDSLKSEGIKNKLFGFYKSGRFGEIKSFVVNTLEHPATPYSNVFRLAKDLKTWRDIKKISEELEKMKEHEEHD